MSREYLFDSNIKKWSAQKEMKGSVLASGTCTWGSNPNLTILPKIATKIEVFVKFHIECTLATEPFLHKTCTLPPLIIWENIFLWQMCLHILRKVWSSENRPKIVNFSHFWVRYPYVGCQNEPLHYFLARFFGISETHRCSKKKRKKKNL